MKQQEYHYAAIGDSLTAGFGVLPEQGFAAKLHELAERELGCKVHFYNAGVTGATAGETLELVQQDQALREKLELADLITVTCGGNNLIQAAKRFYLDGETGHLKAALIEYSTHMRQLVREVKRLKAVSSKPYLIRLIGLYNPLPEFDDAVFWVQRFNKHLNRLAKEPVQAVDVYSAFLTREEELLSDDQFHPNADGYRLLADETHRLGYDPLLEE
ncbi:GDSL-type esterase/lipase family protein [Paenibacillus koleovorans]|uniref:GDSL-type esterase/lipase family protein n=1 Tax=Paenibacillus koleovorans TaxID=121608 RepID=UPI0013E3D430|nr:GDSL-type esterase/lipase family protein [Paenibacillus koleovorans]